jgi:hypothetical protein
MPIGNLSANFINDTQTSNIVKGLFDNVGGSWFVTIMLIVMFIMLIALVMRVPMELTAIFILPLLLVCYAYLPDFLAITGVLLIYIGILIGSNWFFNK